MCPSLIGWRRGEFQESARGRWRDARGVGKVGGLIRWRKVSGEIHQVYFISYGHIAILLEFALP